MALRAPTRLFFAEWSANNHASPDDVDAWYDAVPALGIRISEEFIHAERDAMPDEEFLRERLSIPDMPITDKGAPPTIPADAWQATATTIPHDVAPGGCVFAYDVHDGWASIAIAAGTLSAADREKLLAQMQALMRQEIAGAAPAIIGAAKRSLVTDVHRMGADRALGTTA